MHASWVRDEELKRPPPPTETSFILKGKYPNITHGKLTAGTQKKIIQLKFQTFIKFGFTM